MVFEIEQRRKKWFVKHIMTGQDVMGYGGGFATYKQALAYAKELEAGPFIWYFNDPADLTTLNDEDEIFTYVKEARKKVEKIK